MLMSQNPDMSAASSSAGILASTGPSVRSSRNELDELEAALGIPMPEAPGYGGAWRLVSGTVGSTLVSVSMKAGGGGDVWRGRALGVVCASGAERWV